MENQLKILFLCFVMLVMPSMMPAQELSKTDPGQTESSKNKLYKPFDVTGFDLPYGASISELLKSGNATLSLAGFNTRQFNVYSNGFSGVLANDTKLGNNPALGSEVYNYNVGGLFSLPIISNKLVLGGSLDYKSRQDLTQNGVGSDATSKILTAQDAAAITGFMKARGLDAGVYSGLTTYDNELNARLNLLYYMATNQLININVRFGNEEGSVLNRDDVTFRFGDLTYLEKSKSLKATVELTSMFNDILSNNLKVGALTDEKSRMSTGNPNTPQIQIEGRTPGTMIFLGSDRDATVYDVSRKGIFAGNNFNIKNEKNDITIGTYNEFLNVDYNYINSYNGRVDYRSWTDGVDGSGIEPFLAMNPYRVRGSFNFTDNSHDYLLAHPAAQFQMNNLSLFVQDEIVLSPELKITPALRLEWTMIPNKPDLTSKLKTVISDNNMYGQYATYQYTPVSRINNNYLNTPAISPRVAIEWDAPLNGSSLKIKGMTGLFITPLPLGIISDAYINSGKVVGNYDQNISNSTFQSLDKLYSPGNNGIVNFAQLNGQTVNNPLTGTTQVNLIDNNFKMPSNWSNSFSADFNNKEGFRMKFSAICSFVMTGMIIQQINTRDDATYFSSDIVTREQPIYSGSKIDSRFSSIYLLTNQNAGKGYNYNLSLETGYDLNKQFTLEGSYRIGEAKDLMTFSRSTMEGNWQYNPSLVPNAPKLAYSNDDIRHRFSASLNYKLVTLLGKTNFRLSFSGNSGLPYTYALTNYSLQNSGQYVNLIYIPKVGETKDFFLNADQANAFDRMVNSDSYLSTRRGNYTERNACRTPWSTQLDLGISHTLTIDKRPVVIALDIANISNLINPAWGVQYFVPGTFGSTANPGLNPVMDSQNKQMTQNGNPIYEYIDGTKPYSINYFTSRCRPQLAIKYTF
jgi:hypothetical protein